MTVNPGAFRCHQKKSRCRQMKSAAVAGSLMSDQQKDSGETASRVIVKAKVLKWTNCKLPQPF
jgi:hypothetical protein